MNFNNLYDFLNILKAYNQVIIIDKKVDPILEISEITDRVSKLPFGGKALFFTNTGTKFPVFTNFLGSEFRISLALRHDNLEQLGHEIDALIKILTLPKNSIKSKLIAALNLFKLRKTLPKRYLKKKAPSQQVVVKDPNLFELPILQLWPKDGGRFITYPLVHTVDPITGHRNVGMYRIQVFDKNLVAVHWHRHKTGANHFRKYKMLGKKMPIAIALGGDPVYTYVATAPLPEGVDEYILAGYIRGKNVELVKAITQDIEVPADADIIIEGYIDPDEDFILEGPFGDHTGFYSKPDYYPKMHVTAITYRKNAIYPATVVGIPPQEDAYLAKATERIFLPIIKNSILPEIMDWDVPTAGCGHNYTIVQIKKTYPGQGKKIINALWGAGQMMFNKVMIVVSEDIDIHHYEQVLDSVIRNYNPKYDTVISYGPHDVLNQASEEFTYGSKIGIDATVKFEEEIHPIPEYKPINLKLIENIPNLVNFNSKLLEKGILILQFKKEQNLLNLGQKLFYELNLKNLRFLILIDDKIPINDLFLISWYVGNNIAPARDIKLLDHTLIIDGSYKETKYDNIKEEWENIAVMSKEVIEKIDKIWTELGFKEFIPSPSLKIRP